MAGWTDLIADLRTYAARDTCLAAAVELLIAQHALLGRTDFRLVFVEHPGPGLAMVDWEKLLFRKIKCTDAEEALIAVAASLAIGECHISLREVLPRLDAETTSWVLRAITMAAGYPEIAGALGSWGR